MARLRLNLRQHVAVFALIAGFIAVSHSHAQAQTTPSPSPAASSANASLGQLLQEAQKAGSFTTLSQAVQAAGVGGALKARGGRYTIFAPTDAAFAALPAGTVEKLLKPANRAVLTRILAYHVVPGEYTSKTLKSGTLSTLAGGIAVEATPQRVIVNDANVVQADIKASNGVIHAINRVLLPRELRRQLQSLK